MFFLSTPRWKPIWPPRWPSAQCICYKRSSFIETKGHETCCTCFRGRVIRYRGIMYDRWGDWGHLRSLATPPFHMAHKTPYSSYVHYNMPTRPTLDNTRFRTCTNSRSFSGEGQVWRRIKRYVRKRHACIWLLIPWNVNKFHVYLSVVLHLLGNSSPRPPTGTLPLDTAGELPSFRPPMPALLPNPGYATDNCLYAVLFQRYYNLNRYNSNSGSLQRRC